MFKSAQLATLGVGIVLPAIAAGLIGLMMQPVVAERGENVASFFMGEPTRRVDDAPRSAPRANRRTAGRTVYGNRSICVRLCDGYFFPLGSVTESGSVAEQATQCSSLCPAAPSRLFLVPSGADTIESAASPSDGHLYSELPVAFRYTREFDRTCTCQN